MKSFIKKSELQSYYKYTFLFVLFLLPFAYITAVYATPIYGDYPYQGIFKMSLNKTVDRGEIGMSSNVYDSQILNAYSRVRNSTTGYSEMPSSIWPNGYNMQQNNWSGQWNMYVDTLLYFTYRGPNESAGQIYRSLAGSDFCAIWGQSYPCGMRSTIEIDTYRWYGSYANSPSLKQRLIMHETGHAIGMKDYCSQDSIMNDGTPSCNSGRWTAVMDYKSTDRSAVNSVYR
jgi:hypothetical protein